MGIWQENNRELYSEETFRILKQILLDRNSELPPQKIQAKEKTIRFPLDFGIRISCLRSSSDYNPFRDYKGFADLRADSNGLMIHDCKEIGLDKKMVVKWNDLRNLEDSGLEKGYFSAVFKIEDSNLDLKIQISNTKKNREKLVFLKKHFNELPIEVRRATCIFCGKLLIGNVCENCGRNYAVEIRKPGLSLIRRGYIGIVTCGCLMWWWAVMSNKFAPNTKHTIFYIIAIFSLYFITCLFRGIKKLIFGK